MNKIFYFLLAFSIPVFAVTFDGTETPVEHINKLNQLADETGGNVTVQDDGLEITPNVNLFNYTGAGVSLSEPVADQVTVTISSGVSEGTDILSTGEAGAVKFLREDGDGTSSWQTPAGGGDMSDLVDDLAPQLGGKLDTNTFNIDFDNATGIEAGGNLILTVDGYDFDNASSRGFHMGGGAIAGDVAPKLSVTGSSADIDLELDGKGAGNVHVLSADLEVDGTVDGIDVATDVAANTLKIGVDTDVVDIAHLSATGTADSTTYLRGDNTWSTPDGGAGGGSVINIQSSAPAGCTNEDTYWNSVEGEAYVCHSSAWVLDNAPVSDDVYSALWNGDLQSASRNALYDKIETITGASGTVMKVDSGANLATADFVSTGDIDFMSATGTPSLTTYYRGDNTWATVSGGGGTLTTKGDLESYTTSQVRLPVGTDDHVLTADSTAAAGVAWKVAAAGNTTLATSATDVTATASEVNGSSDLTGLTAGFVYSADTATTASWKAQTGGTGMANLIDDTTPQLGGDLDTNGNNISFDAAHGIYDSAAAILLFDGGQNFYVHVDTSNAAGALLEAAGGVADIPLRLSAKGASAVEILSNVDITGNIVISGTVDGRDVLDDGQAGDNLITLSGNARDAVNNGTFTGTTIADSSTTKAALQALETAVEAGGGGGSSVEVDNGGTISAVDLTSTGDIGFTDTAGVVTADINDGSVTFAKIADIPTAQILGRVTAADGVVELLTATQVRTLLNVVEGAHNTTLATSATDVTATAAEVNGSSDLAGLTAGFVYSADTATTASWKAQTGSGGGTTIKIDSGTDLSTADFVSSGDIDFVDTTGTITANINTGSIAVTDLANGTDGELITWSAAGVATTVPVGTVDYVLTSNGAGAAPTFQAATGGATVTHTESFIIRTATTASDYRVRAPAAMTVSRLDCGATGSPSAHVSTVMECDSAAANCVTTGLTTTHSASGIQSDTAASNGTIDSGDYWGLDTTSLTTAADLMQCTVVYTYD